MTGFMLLLAILILLNILVLLLFMCSLLLLFPLTGIVNVVVFEGAGNML